MLREAESDDDDDDDEARDIKFTSSDKTVL